MNYDTWFKHKLFDVSGEIVGGSADPIPESNIGNRMLQNLGWKPGTGLGADGGGLMTPVMAVKRSGRHGIGSANNDML